jgi:hypothetical protein
MSNKRQSGGGTPQSKRQAQVMLGGQMITPYEVATGRSPSPPPPPSSEEEVEELPPLGEEPIEAHVRLLREEGQDQPERRPLH